MQVGFQIIARNDGHVQFQIREANRRSSLVSYAEDPRTGNAVALLGSLHYRDALMARLPSGLVEPDGSDASLVLAALGRVPLGDLEGEFAMVAWEADRARILVARDPQGAYPLYWRFQGGQLAVGTGLKDLARGLANAEPDPEFLGAFLMNPHAGVERRDESTAFRGVRRVLPGTVESIDLSGRAVRVSTWEWSERALDVNHLDLREAGEAYSTLFRRAVLERLGQGSAAAHLSGGMDSTSVACTARDLVANGAASGTLSTLSLVYRSRELAGEREYIDLIARQGGPVDFRVIDGDQAPDFDWFHAPIPDHDEPFSGLFRVGLERLLVNAASEAGASTILTGAGAEDVLACNRDYIADLILAGKPGLALAEARAWAEAGGMSAGTIFWLHGIEPLLPAWLADGPGPSLRGGFGRWPQPGLFAVPPWIHRGFALEHGMRSQGLSACRGGRGRPVARATDLGALRSAVGNWSSWYLAAPAGMRSSHPFSDPRLTSFGLGLAREVRQRPGLVKPVLGTAMRGVVPDAILDRRVKRSFNAVYWGGLARSLPKLETMVRTCRLRDLGLLDEDSLITAMRQHAAGIGDAMAGGRINSTLALVAWFETWDASPSNSSEVTRHVPARTVGVDGRRSTLQTA